MCVYVYVFVYIYACVCVCVCEGVHTWMYVYVRRRVVCVCVCVCVCVQMCPMSRPGTFLKAYLDLFSNGGASCDCMAICSCISFQHVQNFYTVTPGPCLSSIDNCDQFSLLMSVSNSSKYAVSGMT